MRELRGLARGLAGVAMLLGVFAFGAPSAAAQSDDVRVWIHVLDCPTAAEGDIFEACHDKRLKDVEFDFGDDVTDKSDKEGVAEAELPAGEATIEEQDFAKYATSGQADVYCSPQPEGKPLAYYKVTDGKLKITVGEDELHCDWYNRSGPNPNETPAPGSANIILHKAVCSENTADLFADCHDDVLSGADFFINDLDVTTDVNGVASARVAPGEVTVTEDAATLADYVGAYVFCSVQDGGPVLTDGRYDDGEVTFDVDNGDEVVCDWYNLTGSAPEPTATNEPEPTATNEPATGATIVIHKAECSTSSADLFNDCHENRVEDVDFTIDGDDVTTDEDGVAETDVNAGTVTITESAADVDAYDGVYVYCSVQDGGPVLADGRYDDGEVTFDVDNGDEVVCDWYNLAEDVTPAPTKTASATATSGGGSGSATATPKTQLPDTGAGNSLGSGGSPVFGLLLVLVAAGCAVFSFRRRPAAR